MTRIIGGMFGLALPLDDVTSVVQALGANVLPLCNARSALHMLTQQLEPGRIWLPAYFCPTMLQGISREYEDRVAFFEVAGDLTISAEALRSVSSGDLVILIDYFGWPVARELILQLQEQGAVVLEDSCQVLPGGQKSSADFQLYSPRKYIGLPDGALLISHGEIDVASWRTMAIPSTWWGRSLKASLLRRDFDAGAEQRDWFSLFLDCEYNAPVGSYRMSELSVYLLANGLDYEQIAGRRRQNYLALYNELVEIAVFDRLPEEVVPLGFPVRVEDRARVQEALYADQIYPAVHWALPEDHAVRFQQSAELSRCILTLPCDQRYGVEEMARIAAVLRETL